MQFELCFALAYKCAAIFVEMQAKFVTFKFFIFFASKVTSWTINLAVNFSKMPIMIILAFSRSRITLDFYFMCFIHVSLVGEKAVCFESSKT